MVYSAHEVLLCRDTKIRRGPRIMEKAKQGTMHHQTREVVSTAMRFMNANIVQEEVIPTGRNMSLANLVLTSFSWDWTRTSLKQT